MMCEKIPIKPSREDCEIGDAVLKDDFGFDVPPDCYTWRVPIPIEQFQDPFNPSLSTEGHYTEWEQIWVLDETGKALKALRRIR